MKRILSIFTAVMMILPQAYAGKKGEGTPELKVMSYNVRVSSPGDGTNAWTLRYIATYDMLNEQAPDVLGVQEALDDQVQYIEEFCGYEVVGVGREDGKSKGEHVAIFWNKKTVSMVKWGTFWLSETPDKPSMGWDAEYMRTATWALMKCKKTGNRFYFVNTHLDQKGAQARENGMKLIMDRIAELNRDGLPVVFAGDFNMTPDNSIITDLDSKMQNTRKIAAKTDDESTFNGWGKDSRTLDYIYVSGFSSCPEYKTVTKKYRDWKFISDHYPISAKLIF